MNGIKAFENQEFGTVRTDMDETGKVLFCGSDVAKALGYSRPSDAISVHCRYTVKRRIPHPQSPDKTIEMTFIPEGDVYRLIVGSKLPAADKFERWVFDEVLPTMRRTGGYVSNADAFIANYLSMADESTKQLFKLTLDTIDQLNHKVREQGEQIERDAPDVDFARRISKAPDCYSVACLAKFLNANGYTTGKIRLFNQLRNDGYLGRKGADHNQPLQRYCDMGLFIVQMNPVSFGSEEKFVPTTKVTGKGIRYFYRHYCAPGIKVSDNEIDEAFREFCESEVMAG